MEKLIFRKFAKDLTYFFLLVSISITLIVWVIQAVNFLDIVTEDGHGFRIYFFYTLLTLPKIFSKITPFIYFISIFYIILKYENNNELIIFWTVGIKKLKFINVLIKFSLIYLVLQLFLTTFIVPKTLDKARSYIRSSNVDMYSSIMQEKKFLDTVKNLTIFVEKKHENGDLNNIFLKEEITKNSYQIIFAKKGRIKNASDKTSLILFDGMILNNKGKSTNNVKFSESELNLSKYSTKTTTHPKLQENTTYDVASCIFFLKGISNTFINEKFKNPNLLINCKVENLRTSFQEINKRIILPFYMPVLSLIACLIILKSKDDFNFPKYKFLLFLFGVLAIITSEISIRYSSINFINNIYLMFLPLILFVFIYIYFVIKFRKINFKSK